MFAEMLRQHSKKWRQPGMRQQQLRERLMEFELQPLRDREDLRREFDKECQQILRDSRAQNLGDKRVQERSSGGEESVAGPGGAAGEAASPTAT